MEKEINKILHLAVCEGRHTIKPAIDGSIFGKSIPDDVLTNPKRFESHAFNALWNECFRRHWLIPTDDGDIIQRGLNLNLYATGLTVAVIAILNVCRCEGIAVTLWHSDRISGEYYPQKVY